MRAKVVLFRGKSIYLQHYLIYNAINHDQTLCLPIPYE